MNEEFVMRLTVDEKGMSKGLAAGESLAEKSARKNLALRMTLEKEYNRLLDAQRTKRDASDAAFAEKQARRLLQLKRLMEDLDPNKKTGHGHGNMNGNIQEGAVLVRELSAGRFGAAARSASILAGRMGKLGTILSAVVNPATIAAASLAAVWAVVYKMGAQANAVMQGARQAGVSTQFYRGVGNAASAAGANREGVQGGLGELAAKVGEARSGSLEVYKNFQKWGIALDYANGKTKSQADIFRDVIKTARSIGDPTRRGTFLQSMFGSGAGEIGKAIANGSDLSPSGGTASPEAEKSLSHFWQGTRQVFSNIGSTASSIFTNVVGGAVGTIYKGLDVGRAFFGHAQINQRDVEERRAELAAQGKVSAASGPMPTDLKNQLEEATYRRDVAKSAVEDRGKMGLDEMAAQAQHMTGAIMPVIHTVTPLMRDALKIKQLEARAGIAAENKDLAGMQKYQSEADALRKKDAPFLKRADAQPWAEAQKSLDIATRDLNIIAAMAAHYNKEANAPPS